MKRKLLTLLASCLVLVGCQSVPEITHEDVCAMATTAYAAYLAIIYSDGKPSEDQIAAAQAAAIVLQAQCGWVAPEIPEGIAKINTIRIDRYGVPVLVKK